MNGNACQHPSTHVMKTWPLSLLLLVLVLVLLSLCVACSGNKTSTSSSGSNSAIVFASDQSAPPVSLALNDTASLAAIVTNDPGHLGVNWSVSCVPGKSKGASCGSITQHTASGYPTSYSAPSGDTADALPTGGTVTITATSTADPAQSVAATVQIIQKIVSIGFSKEPPVSMLTGASARFAVSVTNDSKNLGADITLTCDMPGKCGILSSSHTDGMLSGSGLVYTAPEISPIDETKLDPITGLPISTNVVTMTAHSTADPTKTAVVYISVVQAPISVSFYQSPVLNLPQGGATNLSAKLLFDPLFAGIDWTLQCDAESCGSLSQVHTTSMQTLTYTAPLVAPQSSIVTITASSTSNYKKSVAASIRITPTQLRNDLLNGQYAFLLTGVRAGRPSALAGSLKADGIGNITMATETLLGENVSYMMSGIYFVGGDGRGVITLNDAPQGAGYWYNGQQSFRISVIDSGHVLIEEFDGYYDATLQAAYGGTLSGTLELQNSKDFRVPTKGAYSFLLSGSGFQNRPAYLGGVISGTAYSFFADRKIGNTIDSISSNTYGNISFTSVEADGSRGTLIVGPYNFKYYIVDAGHLLLISNSSAPELMAGHMYLQSGAAIPAGTYVFSQPGSTTLEAGSQPFAMGGTFSCGTGGVLAGSIDLSDSSALTSSPITGTCAMSSSGVNSGRGTLTLASGPVQQFAIYPTTHGVLMLQLDSVRSGGGLALSRNAGASLSGNYAATLQRMDRIDGNAGGVGPWSNLVGQIKSDGVASLTGLDDLDQFNETDHSYWLQTPDMDLSGSFAPLGVGTLSGTLITGRIGMTQHIFYVVNDATVLVLEKDNVPATGLLQKQTF